ncbi:MAG: tetratricopeptide repeat protein [Planctomycetota bacterium]|nr:tetratricopeptide repeat protein [Planctomycetota bacterium]
MTPTPEQPDPFAQARQLADEGRHAEALTVLQRILSSRPDDGEVLNDAGALLYAIGHFDEAARHLRHAADCMTDPGQPLWNLAEVYLAAGRPAETLGLFGGLERAGLLTADLANRTATSLLNQGNMADGIEALIESFRSSPEQKLLLPIYEHVRGLRPKVAFFCENKDTKFINDIYAFTAARFETRFCQSSEPAEIASMLRWCDIAWLEWCTPQAIVASNLPKMCRTIVRLHRYEAFQAWPEHVKWENIDALVTVGNDVVVQRLLQRIPDLLQRTRVAPIPNGVDVSRFSFRERPRGKNLAYLARIHVMKNPMMLLQGLARLRSVDPEYRLFFAGEYQDDGALQQYMLYAAKELGLTDAVVLRILADPYRPAEYRDFVEKRFSLARQLARINSLYLDFEKNLVTKPAGSLQSAVASLPPCRPAPASPFMMVQNT